MRDIKNNVNTNANINNGKQIFNGNIYASNNMIIDSYCKNLQYIYNNSKYEEANLDKENKIAKIADIITIISGVASIISFCINLITSKSVAFHSIGLTAIFIISILILILSFSSKNRRIIKALKKEGRAFTKKQLLIKSKSGKIYSVIPPNCPECKNKVSELKYSKIYGQSDIDKTWYEVLLENEQKRKWQYVCKTNGDHTFEIDWTQFNLPEE